MLTTDERREVAARLRKTEIDKCGLTYSAHLGEAIGECVRLVSGHECLVEGGLNRLADLIEPEPERTCRNEDGRCSECKQRWETKEEFWFGTLPNYCPNCGARVVE